MDDKKDIKDLRDTIRDTLNDKVTGINDAMNVLVNLNNSVEDDSVKRTLDILKIYKAGVKDALKLVDYDFDIALNFD